MIDPRGAAGHSARRDPFQESHPSAAVSIERTSTRPRPVFLHGMWRSGSTYVWSKFRISDRARCYFEPLIEGLGRLTPARIRRDTPAVIASNRHPDLAAPYFSEYEPLIGWRGVRFYHRDFATRRFVLGADDRHPALGAYIDALVRHAESDGRLAVLGFNRTVMRQPWITRNFDAYNVQVERDPSDIWASYMERARSGDFTFLTRWLTLVEHNRAAAPFAALAERLPIRKSVIARLGRAKRHYREALASLSAEETYLMVFSVWIAATLQALTHCELILDMGKADRAGYAGERAARIKAAVGLDVAFDDLRRVGPATNVALRNRRDIERAALAMFPRDAFVAHYDPAVCRARLHELTPRKADLIATLL